ncbi:TerC family protein [Plantibacter sp. PA-3-X8]|uniref:Tellurite resistance protein TerC n=1 Tax=Plantibacter cousiniae (nom. nud.) TaxID=199709 RepID=A0ABY1LJU5_9MICO|nr:MULTISPECIES: TerC family protein [Plantibacter]AZH82407.1 TerC family protein [Plantibacter sp. PA-3-X8]MBD8101322.1 TerC family protein [Plantibacter sp. CFBP 8775]MBD8518565.1 TerC family protein [Plantibacter sp. CFBP 8804]MBF4564177.1 TerC family protein [Plantibacter sp. VKM Ac-2876]TKJ99587.1 TerC family protein [Plantibacter flavus]
MEIPGYVWLLTIVGILALLAFDFIFHVRKAHEPTLPEAAKWSALYVGIAIVFGLGVLFFGGGTLGSEYFAGYITEKALSVDNLFVFLIIMSSFRVPRADQQKVLLFGIVFALIARTGFIFLGAAAVNAWSWLFYIFGAFLIFTAIKLLRPEEESDDANNFVIRLAKRLFKTTDRYDGDKLVTIENGKKVLTPMLLVMVAIGGTDLLFALDSIPAIFGLTQNPYIVFTATAFSLLGLRQLYFLIDGLLDRLIFLSYGLAAILGFIGVKLVLHALHENTLPFLNGGEHIPVFEISTGLSLIVIIGILTVTVLASLLSPAGRAHTIISDARTQAKKIVDHADSPEDIPDGHHVDEVELETSYTRMVERQKSFANLKPKHQAKAADDEELQRLLARAHELQAKSSDSRGLL